MCFLISCCVGILATVAFLTGGFIAFKKGQKERMQFMMRGRVFAQGFTLLSIGGSFVMGTLTTVVSCPT